MEMEDHLGACSRWLDSALQRLRDTDYRKIEAEVAHPGIGGDFEKLM